MNATWYLRRLTVMDPAEIAGRVRDRAVAKAWRRRQVTDMAEDATSVPAGATVRLPAPPIEGVSPESRGAVVAAADELLAGRWSVFDRQRPDMVPAPDWFHDPRTGRTAPRRAYAFDIDHRNEAGVGNVKYVWELSRHTSCTVLATAYRLTGEPAYAEATAAQLRAWWDANPFLSGINWTSGIEVGLRLIAWVWTRRLLADWPDVTVLFEHNPTFLRQLHHHHEYLATFRSRGSSANNHAIAEAAGQLTAAAAFDVFPDSARWRHEALETLGRELARQVGADGVHRELATEYHGFVLELGLVAAVEAEAQGYPPGAAVWEPLRRMLDALAALVDDRGRPPRQGDGDEGTGLLVDAPGTDRWASLLATGARLFGPLPWWPEVPAGDVRTAVLAGLATPPPLWLPRPATRPSLFRDSGQVLLRDLSDSGPRSGAPLWCRFDAGPHGYLTTAAHAHADALSVEVRVGGVEVLTDPGTYCYHGDPAWRTWFRSTIAHNTLELDHTDQSVMGGPFLWTRAAHGQLLAATGLDAGPVAEAVAQHDGYTRLHPPAVHQRAVRLDRAERTCTITDHVVGDGVHACRLAYHLGPDVTATLEGCTAVLSWTPPAPSSPATGHPQPASQARAWLELPPDLTWTSLHGSTSLDAGWYSPGFDRRVPTTALVGLGTLAAGTRLVTRLRLEPASRPSLQASTVSALPATTRSGGTP